MLASTTGPRVRDIEILTESKNETGQKGRDVLNRRGHLFSQPGMYQMRITLDPGSHLSTAQVVKETDLLRQSGFQEPLPDPPRSQLGGDLPDDHVSVSTDEHADTDVDEVRGVQCGIVKDGVFCLIDGGGVVAFEEHSGKVGERGGESTWRSAT